MGIEESFLVGLEVLGVSEGRGEKDGNDVVVLIYQTHVSLNKQNLSLQVAYGLQHSELLKHPHSAFNTFCVL